MASGDGLLVRVRPRLGRLTVAQAVGFCTLAQRFGSGVIDLTNRANLQLREVRPDDHSALIEALCDLDLLEADAAHERRPAVLAAPGWRPGDDTERIATELLARLGELPALPAKFGFAVDAGPAPVLAGASADVRIERAGSGRLIVRADGADAGQPVTFGQAVDAALALATWFAATAGSAEPKSKRMRAHLQAHALPPCTASLEVAAAPAALPLPGSGRIKVAFGLPIDRAAWPVYGAAFGQLDAAALIRLLLDTGATAMRLSPNRCFVLESAGWCETSAFVTAADDPLLSIDACPGAPACASATVATRALARVLGRKQAVDMTAGSGRCKAIDTAGGATGAASPAAASALVADERADQPAVQPRPRTLHISGCAKGCARARPADITLVGRDGSFDLVFAGHAWDAPARTGLSVEAVVATIGALDARL